MTTTTQPPTVLVVNHHPQRCAALLERAGMAYLVTDQHGEKDAAERTRSSRAQQVAWRLQMSRYERVYRVSSVQSIEELSAVAADLLVTGADVDKVFVQSEEDQYPAAYLAHLLGTGNHSPRLSLFTRDKRAMKLRAAAAGLPLPSFARLTGDAGDADIERVESTVGYPLVLKPVDGWGAVDTTLARDRAGLLAALGELRGHGAAPAQHLLAEEFIAGDEFHLDAVWRDGQPWTFFVSRYFTPRLELNSGVGLNGSVLLWEHEYPDLYRQMRDLHSRYNAAIGLTRGVTHMEVFREQVTGRLVCSEIAYRPAGANVPEILGLACGLASEDVLAAHELLDGRLADLPPLRPTIEGYLGWINVPPPRVGTVRGVPERAQLLQRPNVLDAWVLVVPGQRIPSTWSSTWGLLLMLRAESEARLTAVATDLAAQLDIIMD